MKSIFALVVFAGTIAHAELSCFKAYQHVWGLPQEICLESVESSGGVLRMKGNGIDLSTQNYFMEEPDMYQMAASFKFVEFYESCGNSLRSTLETKFRMSGSSVTDFSAMSIEVPYETTNDACHSKWQSGVVTYFYYSK